MGGGRGDQASGDCPSGLCLIWIRVGSAHYLLTAFPGLIKPPIIKYRNLPADLLALSVVGVRVLGRKSKFPRYDI